MNDVIITYDSGINTENHLRQKLRAIESFCTGFNEIMVVGEIPDWVQGVITIPFSNAQPAMLLRNQYRKLKAACLNRELTAGFYWVDSADKMIPFDARKATRISIPEGSIFTYRPLGTEKISFEHTIRLMRRRGFSSDGNFFNKYPMSFSKERLMNTFDDIDFETKYGYCIKTLYANFNRLAPAGDINSITTIKPIDKKSSYERD